jgi:polyferredoxin
VTGITPGAYRRGYPDAFQQEKRLNITWEPDLETVRPYRSPAPVRRKFVRRAEKDISQRVRLAVQAAFLLLNLWIGVQFYLWVRWAETGGRTAAVTRPAGVEGWLPIEGMMQLKYVLSTGELPRLHPAAFFLFVTFALSSLLFRKAFCSWICPVGTVQEYLWKLGRRVLGRNFRLPRWVDVPLRSLKYLLLLFFVYAVTMMSAAAIAGFIASPYGLVVDVRMLNFFRFAGSTTLYVLGALTVASILVRNFWCRYLCPYGAWMGLLALFSPVRITRNESACIDCSKCARACPSALKVDKLVQIRSAECTGCLECVAVCPAQDALALKPVVPARRAVASWQVAAGIGIIFFGLVGFARISGHWRTPLPDHVFLKLVPEADQQHHPMPGDEQLSPSGDHARR